MSFFNQVLSFLLMIKNWLAQLITINPELVSMIIICQVLIIIVISVCYALMNSKNSFIKWIIILSLAAIALLFLFSGLKSEPMINGLNQTISNITINNTGGLNQ